MQLLTLMITLLSVYVISLDSVALSQAKRGRMPGSSKYKS